MIGPHSMIRDAVSRATPGGIEGECRGFRSVEGDHDGADAGQYNVSMRHPTYARTCFVFVFGLVARTRR